MPYGVDELPPAALFRRDYLRIIQALDNGHQRSIASYLVRSALVKQGNYSTVIRKAAQET